MLLNHYSMYDVIECNIVSLTTKFTLYCYNRVIPPIVFMNFCLVLRMPMRKTPPDQRTLESVGPISNKPCLAERPYQTPVTDLTLTLTRVCLTMWLKWMNDLSLTERMCARRLFLNCSWGGQSYVAFNNDYFLPSYIWPQLTNTSLPLLFAFFVFFLLLSWECRDIIFLFCLVLT